jgi:hypothetical protein
MPEHSKKKGSKYQVEESEESAKESSDVAPSSLNEEDIHLAQILQES